MSESESIKDACEDPGFIFVFVEGEAFWKHDYVMRPFSLEDLQQVGEPPSDLRKRTIASHK